jgi:hypothetical protein
VTRRQKLTGALSEIRSSPRTRSASYRMPRARAGAEFLGDRYLEQYGQLLAQIG